MKTQISKQVLAVILKKITWVLFFVLIGTTFCFPQKTIKGVVTEKSNAMPIAGVNVFVKGTTIGTLTDINGSYSISAMEKQVLVFSFVGYITQEVKIEKSEIINVSMEVEQVSLQEVVVIGYGVRKRSNLTGATACFDVSSSAPVYYNPSTETYSKRTENGYKDAKINPLSTFSIDVDKASYSNVRRFINQGSLPPVDAVRVEELINYFDYEYSQPEDEHPFAIHTEYTTCPWEKKHQLLRIGLQGKKIETANLPASNLVFLIDVSGSMAMSNKLPLVKSAFKLLVNNLRPVDKVAIVVYAGAAGLVLPPTKGSEKKKIIESLENLSAGGSTAGAEGIMLAYETAKKYFIDGGNNRVILATDGDFNVGISNENDLERFIAGKRDEGIFLSCLGFGMGNYKDSKMEILADKGNGNYAYIDDITEANKVFVNEFGGTLFTIAKDVKIQIEFNPAFVKSYRLIGYENRMLNDEDFKDDTKDAGELGSGHTVTAIYEIIPHGVESKTTDVDELKYQNRQINNSDELASIKFRYKTPEGSKSKEIVHTVANTVSEFEKSSENTRFAASVAMFGMLLSNSEFKGSCTFENMLDIAGNSKGFDKEGYRGEFIKVAKTAKNLGLSADVQ